MNAKRRLGLVAWFVLSLTACSTTPPARGATEPANEPATASQSLAQTPPAWLAQFTLISDIATNVLTALASQEAMSSDVAIEWIRRVAVALAQVPAEAHHEAEAQAWALTALLIEEMAASARACEDESWTAVSDIEAMARALGEHSCAPFPQIVHGLYRSCSTWAVPNMAEFCSGRLQRWELVVGPACEPYPVSEASASQDSAEQPDVLRFTVVSAMLHADEVDAVGETMARVLSERAGRPVRYQSDSGFDYAARCSVAYVPGRRDGDWDATLQDDGDVGTIEVSRSGDPNAVWFAEVPARHRPSSWLRAAGALHLPDEEDFGMGGLGLRGRNHPPPRLLVVDGYHLPRNVGPTWRAITALHERCNPWGVIEFVVSISSRGQLVRATPRTPLASPFDVPGVRCLERELDALTRPGRAVGRAVIELSPGPESAPASDAFPLDNSPRVDACVADTLVDLCLDVAPDGTVAHWNAALAWENFPRALTHVTPTPIAPAMARCLAGVFERGVACTQRGEQQMHALPSRP